MASSDQTIDISQNKLCSRCAKCKAQSESIRLHGDQEKEFSTCNDCSEKRKGKRPSNPEPVNK